MHGLFIAVLVEPKTQRISPVLFQSLDARFPTVRDMSRFESELCPEQPPEAAAPEPPNAPEPKDTTSDVPERAVFVVPDVPEPVPPKAVPKDAASDVPEREVFVVPDVPEPVPPKAVLPKAVPKDTASDVPERSVRRAGCARARAAEGCAAEGCAAEGCDEGRRVRCARVHRRHHEAHRLCRCVGDNKKIKQKSDAHTHTYAHTHAHTYTSACLRQANGSSMCHETANGIGSVYTCLALGAIDTMHRVLYHASGIIYI